MADDRDWRLVGASERGVSHAADGLPCQDAHQCFLVDARTVLLVAGDETGLFAQLGDGGIVERRGTGWSAVFWRRAGTLANVANFVTDADALERLVFERRAGGSECVAVFTDGLERLAGAAVASAQAKADAGVR